MHLIKRLTDSESTLFSALGWSRTSDEKLQLAEADLLDWCDSLGEGEFVDIGPVISSTAEKINTYSANTQSTNTPLVLVHGFAAGAALWCLNIDTLAKDRPVYAFDLLGFGRSSRPTFSTDPSEVEKQFVKSIEAWRQAMGLEKFYLLGHSFGAYISTLYAMRHPDRVEHLIAADPFGFAAKPKDSQLPIWARPVEKGAAYILPLTVLRAFGPLGYMYLRLIPPFDTKNFPTDNDKAIRVTATYFYHANARKPGGEAAFHCLMAGIGWAKKPIIKRIHKLRKEVPITFLFGQESWMWKTPAKQAKLIRKASYVDIRIIDKAGHLLYTEQPKAFNAEVCEVLAKADAGEIPTNPLTLNGQMASPSSGDSISLSSNESSEKVFEELDCEDLRDEDLPYDLAELDMSHEETEKFFMLNNISLSDIWKNFKMLRSDLLK